METFSTHDGDADVLNGLVKLPIILCQKLFQDLQETNLDTFLKQQKQTLPAEPFWSPIINSGDPATDNANALNMEARFTTKNEFLVEVRAK